jgi:hypothetical protein
MQDEFRREMARRELERITGNVSRKGQYYQQLKNEVERKYKVKL